MNTLDQLLAALESRQHVSERPFSSRTPIIGRIIAWFRTQWNNVATRWYVLPIMQQQNAINELWLMAFKEQTQISRERLEMLKRDQVTLIEQMAELSYRLIRLEERIEQVSGRRENGL